MLVKRTIAGIGLASLGLVAAFGCAQSVQMDKMDAGSTGANAPADIGAHGKQAVSAKHEPATHASNPVSTQDSDEETIKVVLAADIQPDRYLIKNATLTVEAQDVRRVASKVIAGATEIKGYVSGLHETVDALGTRSVTFSVRVPSTQFDTFLRSFESQGKVLDREVTAEDVTEEFIDTQSKVRNLRSTEARLLSHLSKTGRLSDTLLIEKEINRVREEMDRLTGRLKFLAHRVSYSTFNITVRETPHAQAITPAETFSAGKVVSDSARSLVTFSQQILTMGIWLLMWSVVWLPPLLILGYVKWRKRGVPSRSA